MQLFIRWRSRLLLLLMLSIILIAITMQQKVHAGKPTISLNSPASFPVDI